MKNRARGNQVGERTTPAKGKEEKEPVTSSWPTREEYRAAREHLDATYADVNRFIEETLREIEEDKKAGRVEDPAGIDMDLWKKSYAKIIRDYPPPEFLLPAAAAATYLK